MPAAALAAGLDTLQLGEGDPTRGKAHLVAHHAALQQRSYLSALRSLHRFFDYNAGVLARMLIPRLIVTPHGTIQLCTLSKYNGRVGPRPIHCTRAVVLCMQHAMCHAWYGENSSQSCWAWHRRDLVAANQTRTDLVHSRTAS